MASGTSSQGPTLILAIGPTGPSQGSAWKRVAHVHKQQPEVHPDTIGKCVQVPVRIQCGTEKHDCRQVQPVACLMLSTCTHKPQTKAHQEKSCTGAQAIGTGLPQSHP
ncbi:hypothetical protein H920_05881 [Fukomys damarensis]|uniref:Uncharacterized protein n=1 Tax=Fukomys damarensis TaxID=885580 RepID=A0A091DNU3_FUKDA|nr:hypothetical protein H920_05881 [Fukomys damarensis]